MAKLVAVLSTVCVFCMLLGAIIYLRLFAPGAPFATFNPGAIVKEVRPLNELVTIRYSIQKVVAMKEQKSPVGEESILLLVQGKVLAGVDVSKITAGDITSHGRGKVNIRLPRAHLQEAFLDEKETRVWDRSITWWTPWVSPDLDLEHKARLQAIEDMKAAALEMGILRDAQHSAEVSIRALLQALGIEVAEFDYTSEYKPPEPTSFWPHAVLAPQCSRPPQPESVS